MCLQGGGRIDAESETFVAIPLDLRNATRDPDKHDEQNRQGCGVGAVGEPAPTLTKEFVPGVAHSLRAEGHDAGEDGTGRGVPLVPVAWDEEINAHEDISGAIVRGGDGGRHAGVMYAVRRLLPSECEILMGFPRGYTNITRTADGPRYKALGNSFAVPVVAWIGRRIKEAYANN